MNPDWMLFFGTIVAQLIIGVFIYGQLTQRVRDQGGWLKRHDAALDRHGEQLVDHEGRISHIEGHRGLARSAERP